MKDHRKELNARRIAELSSFANELADHARLIVNKFDHRNYRTVYKPDGAGPVSALDKEIENNWKSRINKEFPNHNVIGEETGAEDVTNDFVWLLDPIDGTDDLIRGIPLFGSIIAVLYRGFPIVGIIDHPKLMIRCKAAYGLGSRCNGKILSINGTKQSDLSEAIVLPAYADFKYLENYEHASKALNEVFPNQRVYRNVYGHTMVALGMFAACLEVNVNSWDILASQLIIEEANGKFIYLQDRGVDCHNRRISAVFGRASIIRAILSIIKRPAASN